MSHWSRRPTGSQPQSDRARRQTHLSDHGPCRLLRSTAVDHHGPGPDITGTSGVAALTYGLTRGGEHGWADTITLTAFAAAAVLLVAFVASQALSNHPLLPLRLLADRNRTGAYTVVLFIGAGLMGTFYLATLFMQEVLAFGPLRAGAAALPFGVGIILASGLASKLVENLPPRAVAAPGLLLAAAGMFWLSTLEADSGHWTHLMAPIFLTSAGLGLAFGPMTLTVVHGVAEQETGVASALLNTAQQIGAALALLTTVATSAAASHGPAPTEALAHGYGTAYLAGSVAMLVAAILAALLVSADPQQERQRSSSIRRHGLWFRRPLMPLLVRVPPSPGRTSLIACPGSQSVDKHAKRWLPITRRSSPSSSRT